MKRASSSILRFVAACTEREREREREEERVAGAALGSCRPFSAIVALCCECSRTLENTRYCPAPGDPTITRSRYDLICIPPSSCLPLPSGVLLPSSLPLTHSLTFLLFFFVVAVCARVHRITRPYSRGAAERSFRARISFDGNLDGEIASTHVQPAHPY